MLARPLSTGLSLILLIMGTGLISLLLLLNKQLDNQFNRNMKDIDLVVGAKGSPLQLVFSAVYHIDPPTGNIPMAAAQNLMRNPMVKKAIPLAYGDSYQTYRIVGTTKAYPRHYGAEIETGDWWKEPLEAVVGALAAEQLGLKTGDTFLSNHGFDNNEEEVHGDMEFKVVGVLKPSNSVIDQLILTGMESVWMVHDHEGEHDHNDDHDGDHNEGHAAGDHDGDHAAGDHDADHPTGNHDADGHNAGDHDADHIGDQDAHDPNEHMKGNEEHDDEHHQNGLGHEDHSDAGDQDAHSGDKDSNPGGFLGSKKDSEVGPADSDPKSIFPRMRSNSTPDKAPGSTANAPVKFPRTQTGPAALQPKTYETDPEKEITALLLEFKSPLAKVMIPRTINEQNTALQAAQPSIEISRLFDLMGLGLGTLRGVAFAIILVSALSVFFSLLSSLKDRRYELALMRSLGASRGMVFALILVEGLMLSFIGCLFGLLFSRLGMQMLSGLVMDSYHYKLNVFTFLPAEIILIFAALGVGALAAMIPALQAFNTQISKTLANA